MIKKLLVFIILLLFFAFPVFSYAQENVSIPKDEVVKAKIVWIMSDNEAKVIFLEGAQKGEELNVPYAGLNIKVGDIVVVNKTIFSESDVSYQIIDKHRLNEILAIVISFFVLVLLLSRWRGLGSFFGMFVSLAVIVKYIVPAIIEGRDPIFVSIVGSLVILVTSIYLAHGFSKQTTIAVVSTFITLVLAGIFSVIFVNLTGLTGLGSEDVYALQFGDLTSGINFRGLLLGGMIIGFLGVLDDVTTGLSATVFELKKQSPQLTFGKLVKSTLNIGQEHVSSLVNTLILAYAGASLPIFLFIVLNPQKYPIWFMINSELISQEIVRTLSGSMGLLFAVPVTTFLAALAVSKRKA